MFKFTCYNMVEKHVDLFFFNTREEAEKKLNEGDSLGFYNPPDATIVEEK